MPLLLLALACGSSRPPEARGGDADVDAGTGTLDTATETTDTADEARARPDLSVASVTFQVGWTPATPVRLEAGDTFVIGASGVRYLLYFDESNAVSYWCEGGVYLVSPSVGDAQRLPDDALADAGDGDVCMGASLASGFDFDGDGVDDLVAGAPYFDQVGTDAYLEGRGEAVVFSGAALGARALERAAEFTGMESNAEAGMSVSGAADVDGDGLDEVAVGSEADGVWIVAGGSLGFGQPLDDVALGRLEGGNVEVTAVGDVDGDGLTDLAMVGSTVGAVDIVPGSSLAGTFTAADSLLSLYVENPDRWRTPAPVGDWDGDGVADVFIQSLVSCGGLVAEGGGDVQLDASNAVAFYDPDGGRMRRNVTVGDFDGDGEPDLSNVGLYGGRREIYLFHLGDLPSAGSVDAELAFRVLGQGGESVSYYDIHRAMPIDWNGDGIDDLLSFAYGDEWEDYAYVQIGSVFLGR